MKLFEMLKMWMNWCNSPGINKCENEFSIPNICCINKRAAHIKVIQIREKKNNDQNTKLRKTICIQIVCNWNILRAKFCVPFRIAFRKTTIENISINQILFLVLHFSPTGKYVCILFKKISIFRFFIWFLLEFDLFQSISEYYFLLVSLVP